MQVDSFRFLPRSFRPMYENPSLPVGEPEGPVWAPFGKRLAESRLALLSSAGIHLHSQPAFDLERERAEPEWGDPSWRAIPADTAPDQLAVAHHHISDTDILLDPEIALPMRGLAALVKAGIVGSATPTHISVMGFQAADLAGWRNQTAPEVTSRLRSEGADGVILAPA